MNNCSLKNWKLSNEMESLLFFAQRMRECAFYYTYDSYKFPALYTSSICREAIGMLNRIEKGEFSEKSIIPIIDELKLRIHNDVIVNKIVGENLNEYLSFDTNNFKESKLRIKLLYNKIRPNVYVLKSQQVIKELIIENKKKEVLDKVIPNYIAALVDCGYSLVYINSSITTFFFKFDQVSPKIISTDSIDLFFNIFTLDPHVYTIIFKGSKLFNGIKESCIKFDIEILDKYDDIYNEEYKSFFEEKEDKQLYVVCKRITSLDAQSAKESAEYRLKRLFSLFNCFHHKSLLNWSQEALIVLEDNEDKKEYQKISLSFRPMLNCKDMFPLRAAEKLNLFLANFGLSDRASFNRFSKLLDLHSLSSQNPNYENQLLQLWIAAETVLVGYENMSKIDQVLNSLIPSLMLSYLKSTISNLADDLKRWNANKTNLFLNEIDKDANNIERVAALVAIKDNENIRTKFYQELSEFPLLKFRIYTIQKIFSSPKLLSLYYDCHKKKIEWQIRRIYMTRNLIVHTGKVPDYTPMLIENMHKYLDTLTVQIINLVINNQVTDISQALKEISILQKKHEKFIHENKDKNTTLGIWNKLILGFENLSASIEINK